MPAPARRLLPPALAMAAVVAVSNFAVQYPLGAWLTWGSFTYPFAFLVTDLTNRAYGPGAARAAAAAGFAVGVPASLALSEPRIAFASGAAFISAQLLDVWIFHRLRQGAWWRAPLVSSLASMAADTALFFALAFAGTGLPWRTWALGDYAAKLAMAAALLAPYRALALRLPAWREPRAA